MTEDEAIYTIERVLSYRERHIEITDDLRDALYMALDALKGKEKQ